MKKLFRILAISLILLALVLPVVPVNATSTMYLQTVGFATGNTISHGATTYFAPFGDFSVGDTTEARVAIPIRDSYTISKMAVNVVADTLDGDAVITFRKNGGDTTLAKTIPQGSTAGIYTNLTSSFTVTSGDTIDIAVVAGGSSGAINLSVIDWTLTGSSYPQVSSCGNGVLGIGSNFNPAQPIAVGGASIGGYNDQFRANYTLYQAVTYSNLTVYGYSNTYAGTATITLYKNGSATDLSVSVGPGVNGLVEDTTHSVSCVSGDYVCFMPTGSAGAGTVYFDYIAMKAVSAGNVTVRSRGCGLDQNGNVTRYLNLTGQQHPTINVSATEAPAQSYILAPVTAKNLQTTFGYCDNTQSSIVITLMKNGSPTNLAVTVPANSTFGAQFANTTDTVSLAVGDLVSFKIVTDAGAGYVEIYATGMQLDPVATTEAPIPPIDSYTGAKPILIFLPGLLLLALIIMVSFIGFGQIRQGDTIAAITIFSLAFVLVGFTLLIGMPLILQGAEAIIWFK